MTTRTVFEGDHAKFLGWSQLVYAEMIKEGCHEHVLQRIGKPAAPDLSAYPGSSLEMPPTDDKKYAKWSTLVNHYQASLKLWSEKQMKSYGLIYAGVSEVLRLGLDSDDTKAFKPFESWDFLHKTYGTRNISGARLEFQRSLFRTLKMQEQGEMVCFLIEFRQCALTASVLDEVELITQICQIGILPSRFENLCQIISTTSAMTWTECQRILSVADARYQAHRLHDTLASKAEAVRLVKSGKDPYHKTAGDRRSTPYDQSRDNRATTDRSTSADHYRPTISTCFQCGNLHKFWHCISRNCPTCEKFDVHSPLDCPLLSHSRKQEFETWKKSRNFGKSAPLQTGTRPAQDAIFIKPKGRLATVGGVLPSWGKSEESFALKCIGAEECSRVEPQTNDHSAIDELGYGSLDFYDPSFCLGEIGDVEEARIALGHVNMIRSRKRKNEPQLYFLDSGAAVHCTPSQEYLCSVRSITTSLLAANDSIINVTFIGNINEYIVDVHVTPGLEISLLSEDALRRTGLWVLNPPCLPTTGVFTSAYICDQVGNVIYTVDQDRLVDVTKVRSDMKVPLPCLPDALPRVALTSTLRAKHSLDSKGISDFVFFIHQCLGHPCQTTMLYMADHETLEGFPLSSAQIRKHWVDCPSCWKGKMHRRVPKAKTNQTSSASTVSDTAVVSSVEEIPRAIGAKISSDIYGPLPEGIGNRKYVISFTDAASGIVMIGTAVHKTFLYESVKQLILEYAAAGHHEPQFARAIAVLQSDAEKIYQSSDLQELARGQGIKLQWSAPHAHEQNGVAERMHRWIGESLATVYSDAPWVPISLWPYAIAHIALCLNLHPRVRKNMRMSPFQHFYGKKPSFNSWILLPWGAPLLFAIPPENRIWKGASHCHEGIYMGAATECKEAIRVFNMTSKRMCITYSWHELALPPSSWPTFKQVGTIFIDDSESDEIAGIEAAVPSKIHSMACDELTTTPAILPLSTTAVALEISDVVETGSKNLGNAVSPISDTLVPTIAVLPDVISSEVPAITIVPTRPRRATAGIYGQLNQVQQRAEWYKRIAIQAVEQRRLMARIKKYNEDSPSMKQALASPQRDSWIKAMKCEMDQLELLQVFEEPTDNFDNYVQSMFVLKRKMDAEGNWTKFKARLVAIGSRQPVGTFDYCGSSTARNISVKIFMSYLASRGERVVGYDVPGAYLHATTAEASTTDGNPNIHIRLPDGSIKKLSRFLYGTKQAGAEWYDRYSKFLLSLGYDRSPTEPCLWIWRSNREAIWGEVLAPEELFHLLCVFVDDNLAGGNCTVARDFFEAEFAREFGKCDRKEDRFTFLGMLIESDHEMCKVSMPSYCEKLVLASGIHHSKISRTPGDTRAERELAVDECDERPADREDYMRLVGVVNFFALTLRFDLLNSVSRLSQHLSNPLVKHAKQLSKVCKFVNGTKERCLIFRRSSDRKLRVFVDASYDSTEESRSQSGEAWFFGLNSSAFHCKSSRQKVVAHSAAEAELIALYELLRSLVWIQEVMEDMGFGREVGEEPPMIYEDNSATLVYADGGGNFNNVKHMRRRIANVNEFVSHGIGKPVKVASKDNCADAMTKQSEVELFEFHCDMIFNGAFVHVRE